MHAKLNVKGVSFPVIDYDDAMELFSQWMTTRTAHQVCIVNVHTLVTAMREPAFHAIIRASALATMDGQPLKWYANAVCGAGVKERVCGPELMLRCLARGVAKGWRHFLLGGRPEVLNHLETRIQERFPGARIVGTYSPPFRPATESEEAEVVARINQTDADILWVGLGAPRQEQWIHRNLGRLRVPVCVGVGAAFDFHAGSVSRAPAWMQSAGLEWLYRSCADPRLIHRYFDTNPPFLWMLIRDWFRVRFLRQSGVCGN